MDKENRFTGWTDVDLTEKGIEEQPLPEADERTGFVLTLPILQFLKRAIRTLWWRWTRWMPCGFRCQFLALNERHYGPQGLNKAETAQKYGEEQVLIWRRSYDIRPPAWRER